MRHLPWYQNWFQCHSDKACKVIANLLPLFTFEKWTPNKRITLFYRIHFLQFSRFSNDDQIYMYILKKKIITYLCNKKYLSSSIFKTNSRSTYFATTHNTVFNCITDVFKYALSQSIHFKEIVRSPTNRATFLLYLLETRSHVASWNKSKEYFSIEWKIYFIEIKVLQNFTISDNNNPPVNEFELIWIEPNIFVACF